MALTREEETQGAFQAEGALRGKMLGQEQETGEDGTQGAWDRQVALY